MTDQTTTAAPDSTLVTVAKAVLLLRESPVGVFGGLIVLTFVLLAVFAPLVAPFDPNATILPFATPGTENPEGGIFLFGTDHLGPRHPLAHHLGRAAGAVLRQCGNHSGLRGRDPDGTGGGGTSAAGSTR